MRHARMTLASAVSGASVLASLLAGSGPAAADPAAPQINWNTHVEGNTVVTDISDGGFHVVDDAVELADDSGTAIVKIPLTFRFGDRDVPLAADISDNTLRLTPDAGQIAELRSQPLVPLAADLSPITPQASEIGLVAIPGAVAIGSAIGSAVGGVIGLAVGCAVGATGAGAAGAIVTAATAAVPAALGGCGVAGATGAGVGGTIGGAIGAGIGVIVGGVLPTP